MSDFGPQLERLLAVAVSEREIAIGGRRDFEGATASQVHLLPHAAKAKPRSIAVDAAVNALLYSGLDLLIAGTSGGRLVGWDVSAAPAAVIGVDLGAAVRSLALTEGWLVAGTEDGAGHIFK